MSFMGWIREQAAESGGKKLQGAFFRKKGLYENEIYSGMKQMLEEFEDGWMPSGCCIQQTEHFKS